MKILYLSHDIITLQINIQYFKSTEIHMFCSKSIILQLRTSVVQNETFDTELHFLTCVLSTVSEDNYAMLWWHFDKCSLLLSLKLEMLFSQKLNSHRKFKGLAKALIRLRVCPGWSEPLLVAHTTLLEISCPGSIIN